MRQPTVVEVLTAWEHGTTQPASDRALTMLSMAYPEGSFAQLAGMSIGRRDAALLALHETLFGPSLPCYAECPACSSALQFTVDVRDFPPSTDNSAAWEIVFDNVRLRFRAPNTHDLAEASQQGNPSSARALLLERCVLEAEQDGRAVPAAALPAAVIEEMSSHLSQSETHADLWLTPECVACGHRWELTLDIGSFIWAEIHSLARRQLSDVHALAWAYGWREADILAMSPVRRQFYLDRLQ